MHATILIGGRKLMILGVADVSLHLLVRIAGHAMGCSRPMNATAAKKAVCTPYGRPLQLTLVF